MIEIKLQSNIKTKSYLVKFNQFEFDSLLHFIFKLFINNKVEDENIDATIMLEIIKLGYNDVTEIPNRTKKNLKRIYNQLLEEHTNSFDEETFTYLLMEEIVKSNILVIIDNNLISNTWKPVMINKNSIISFVSGVKLQNINFKTI